MKHSITLCTIVLLSAVMTNSYAFSGGQGKGRGAHLTKFINKFDSNGDKTVSKEEFSVAMEQRFKKMDADGNGVVSQEEFKQSAKAKHKKYKNKHKGKIDTDKDGVVSKQEYLDAKRIRAEKKFAELDKDNNGSLTDDELKAGHSKFKKSGHYFSKIDKNADGVISSEENKASSSRLFKKLDSNEDQVITQEEIQAMTMKRKGKK